MPEKRAEIVSRKLAFLCLETGVLRNFEDFELPVWKLEIPEFWALRCPISCTSVRMEESARGSAANPVCRRAPLLVSDSPLSAARAHDAIKRILGRQLPVLVYINISFSLSGGREGGREGDLRRKASGKGPLAFVATPPRSLPRDENIRNPKDAIDTCAMHCHCAAFGQCQHSPPRRCPHWSVPTLATTGVRQLYPRSFSTRC